MENAVAKVHFRMSFCKTQIIIATKLAIFLKNKHAFVVCFHVVINIYTRIAFREFFGKNLQLSVYFFFCEKIAESSMVIVLIPRFLLSLAQFSESFESIFVEHCIGSFVWIMMQANKRCVMSSTHSKTHTHKIQKYQEKWR